MRGQQMFFSIKFLLRWSAKERKVGVEEQLLAFLLISFIYSINRASTNILCYCVAQMEVGYAEALLALFEASRGEFSTFHSVDEL